MKGERSGELEHGAFSFPPSFVALTKKGSPVLEILVLWKLGSSLAEKCKAHPKEAAVLLENGTVLQWYESNGWAYPVAGTMSIRVRAFRVAQFLQSYALVVRTV